MRKIRDLRSTIPSYKLLSAAFFTVSWLFALLYAVKCAVISSFRGWLYVVQWRLNSRNLLR